MGCRRPVVLALVALWGIVVVSKDIPALQVEVTKEVRCQDKASTGDKVTVHYGGFLQDGKKFDSSFDRAQPFTFTIGVGQVIPGWDQGLIGVCKGEERHLVVPSPLAYGDRGAGDVIPPGATLLFDIVIVDVEKELSDAQKNVKEKKRKEEEAKKREDEEFRRKEKEEKVREEEVRRVQQAERARDKELRRKAEEERVREEELAKEKALEQELARKAQEEKRRKAEQRKNQEQKRRREEQKKRAEQKRQKEEEEKRRKEQEEDEIRRRQKESAEYEYDEDYEYEYEDYESSCEAGELKMQVTSSPARCSKISRTGNKLTMHYTGKLSSGKKFDSSVDRNKPFQFTLGVGQVIAGWDEGLIGMCVGEKRTLVIPPDMAYGEQGVGAVIPPCSVLVFEVELLDIAN